MSARAPAELRRRRRAFGSAAPPALSAEQIAHARQLISEDKKPAEVARLLGVHRATLYRALERNDVNTH